MEMGLNPSTPRHGRECGARSLNGRIIEDELGSCQLGSPGLIWFNFVLMFLSPAVLWHSRRGGSGAAGGLVEPAEFWPEQLGEVIFGPPKISYGSHIAKTPLECLQPFPKRLGYGMILGEDTLQCPACKTAGGASQEQGAGGKAASGKSWLENQ